MADASYEKDGLIAVLYDANGDLSETTFDPPTNIRCFAAIGNIQGQYVSNNKIETFENVVGESFTVDNCSSLQVEIWGEGIYVMTVFSR